MESVNQFLSLQLFENSLLSLGSACLVALLTLLVCIAARRRVRQRHARMLRTENTELMEIPLGVLGRTTTLFFIVLSAFLGLKTLELSGRTEEILDSAITIALFWQMGVWLSAAAMAWLERRRRASLSTDRALAGSIGIIGLVVRGLIWVLVALLTLDNLGVNITALVAGLGIGGVAVALAVQTTLGDLLASLSITLDKPFVVGDFLSVGDFLGSVEYIGIKSTRLRSLSGEQIVMPNADLLGSRVRNYGRMAERRVTFTLNVTYGTDVELLERIPREIRAIVEAREGTRFDRSHFSTYAAHSLDFETVYYVLSADYNRYMDIQQAINLAIYRRFAELGVDFAFPTRTLYLERVRREARGGTSPPRG